ncbi:3-dehydroquinate synthase [Propioniciclava coleopterorum]|uniref:3-dehydroquinate synthase n=1 Tax=Propioniciclava coleopterorum TaxID=2714937 RepID=A0A6G7YA11_9ACTN|nr:3-dehydroquinate synthase [Propioniciclava coleopterorum]QIK73559.1 3-dehydroquinate synthase [Propioniciclava coleopterorum]
MTTQWETITVASEHPYDVVVGRGTTALLPGLVEGSAKVALLHPAELADAAAALAGTLDAEVLLLTVPDGERVKTPAFLLACWEALAGAGFTRSDAVVGFGGGATTDLAGFVAATWLRGVRYVSIPTTLLAMVDAAVGGKTGINLDAGKNLVGAFWEPAGVLADLDHLVTLAPDDLRGGLAEMIKHGFIADERTLELFEADPAAMLDPRSDALAEAITRSMRIKAGVVSGDLREATSTGSDVGRELLNYGHTLGHAIERRERYTWRHGYAVAVGLAFAARLSHALGHADAAFVERHLRVLESVGLPTSYAADAYDDLRATMSLDKKSRGASLRFVLLDAVGAPFMATAPDEDVLRATYAELAR